MKLASRMDRLGTETAFEVLAKAKKLEAEGKEIIHLEIGEPDFDTPNNIVEAGRVALSNGFTHYGPSPGLMEVRDTIAQEVRETRGIDVTAENVVITPGAKPIMFFVIMALIDEGDEVLYPNPGFPIYESMINFVGGVPVPMELSMDLNFDIDLDKVIESITPKTKMIIVNSPNNPCGSIVSKSSLIKLADLACQNDIIVLSDEIYRRFLYGGDFQSISSFNGMIDRTIILDGLSKTYAMTGWRIGYGVMPIDLVDSISKLSTNSVSCTASFTQIAASEAITGPQERALEIVDEFNRRRHIIVNGLNSIKGINCPMPEGAFYVFPSIKDTGMESRFFADKLLQDFGVASLAGESFGEFGKGHLRFSFANSVENIEKALDKINEFVQSNS